MKTKIINDCLNTITFKGDQLKIKDALAYITDTKTFRNACLGKNIMLTKYGYTAHTDWEPNITGVKRIADMFGLDFNLLYDEPGNQLFGEIIYKSGMITMIELDDTDFSRVSFDEDSGLYTYGSVLGCDISEFFVQLLFEKIYRAWSFACDALTKAKPYYHSIPPNHLLVRISKQYF